MTSQPVNAMSFGSALGEGQALVVGASQGIGLEFVRQLLENDRIVYVYATYRQSATATGLLALADHPQLTCLQVEATQEEAIAQAAETIQSRSTQLDLLINCVGILHEGTVLPEKSLRQINPGHLLQYFQVNSVPAVLLAKHFQPLLKGSDCSVFATLSAKIGSISDNQSGGWYGYRASKAALNMFLKTIAIEFSRKNPHTIVVALHPGTTDTRLSQPFQRTVPPEKLFSCERTVRQLLGVIDDLTAADNGTFRSWDGSIIPW